MLKTFDAKEIYKIPECRMYWNTEEDGIFPVMNFGKVISRNRFEISLVATNQ